MKSLIVLLFILLLFTSNSKSQSIHQYVLSSNGGYYSNNSYQISYTIGEVIIDTYFADNYFLTQGFHQPTILENNIEDDFEFYNGFSPNGDGKNDYWEIPMLVNFPKNTVTILNRWGVEVWKHDDYDNDKVKFVGKNMNNEDLSDGTYYYVIVYGLFIKNGWVFIKR